MRDWEGAVLNTNLRLLLGFGLGDTGLMAGMGRPQPNLREAAMADGISPMGIRPDLPGLFVINVTCEMGWGQLSLRQDFLDKE